MFCMKCGVELTPDDKFCANCGATVESAQNVSANDNIPVGQPPEQTIVYVQAPPNQQNPTYMAPTSYGNVFVDPDEQLLGTLGNGYLENILNKKVRKCHALLTDKRVYFQGTFFSGSGKSLQQDNCEKIVDLEDITGTGFLYSKPLGILLTILSIAIPWIVAIVGIILGVAEDDDYFFMIALPGIAVGIIAILGIIITYIKRRKTYFLIEYAGGAIRFNASIIGLSHVKDFQKQIRRAKDLAKGKI